MLVTREVTLDLSAMNQKNLNYEIETSCNHWRAACLSGYESKESQL